MKNGCKVKVKINDKWYPGTLLNNQTLLVGVPYYFNYKEEIFTKNNVKELVQLPQDEIDKKHAQELPQALNLIQNALQHLLPDEKATTIDQCISAYNGRITLDPVVYEQQTISQFIEHAAWQVTAWQHHQATDYQPEDTSDSPVGVPTNFHQAAVLFVETLFKMKNQDYWQNIADNQYAESLDF